MRQRRPGNARAPLFSEEAGQRKKQGSRGAVRPFRGPCGAKPLLLFRCGDYIDKTLENRQPIFKAGKARGT